MTASSRTGLPSSCSAEDPLHHPNWKFRDILSEEQRSRFVFKCGRTANESLMGEAMLLILRAGHEIRTRDFNLGKVALYH